MNARWLLSVVLSTMVGALAYIHAAHSFGLFDRADKNRDFKKEPGLMLWAWEYPCDLRFVDSEQTGVAFLAARVNLSGDTVSMKPRTQALKVNPDTYLMAVIRIETSQRNAPSFSDEQLESLISRITYLLSIKPIQAIQIDFDAKQSERQFYGKLLQKLIQSLPSSIPISITSLASWCLRDTWIKDLPCDEIVPMFFSMGRDRERMLGLLKSDNGCLRTSLTDSIGLSVDEPDVLGALPTRSEHVYLFSSKGWNTNRAINWVKSFETGGVNWKRLATH